MTREQLTAATARYRAWMDEIEPDILARQFSADESDCWSSQISREVQIAHFKFMCDEIPIIASRGDGEKAMRWFGFLQGVLWKTDLFKLDHLKSHSAGDLFIGFHGRDSNDA